jgi:hypothetical protein
MRRPDVLWLIPLLAALTGGCSPSQLPSEQQAPLLTYHQDTKAILNHYCTDCHKDGGIAPWTLTSYQAAKAHLGAIEHEVSEDAMPPWAPSELGVPLRFSRKLAPADKKILLDWIKQGAPEGDPGAASRVTIAPLLTPDPPKPDLVVDMGVTYQPNKGLTDDYRCFVIEPNPSGSGGMPENHWLRAGMVKPGNQAIDHHVLVFQIPESRAASIKKKDAMDPGPGYSCLGQFELDMESLLMVWTPGGVPLRLRDDEGIPVKKGSIFVIQVHYNVASDDGKGDRTSAVFEYTKTVPPYLVYQVPYANPDDLKIPAGDPDAVQIMAVPVKLVMEAYKIPGNELVIHSIFPHMHLLGSQISTTVGHDLLVDIPQYEFHWQQTYLLEKPYVAKGNQVLSLECHFNNSAENQPVINGKKSPPREVRWGESTGDEMCLNYLGVRVPNPTP